MSSDYKMPEVRLGDIVLWREGKATEPAAAVVTAVGGDTLAVNVLSPFFATTLPKDGVRYIDDPNLNKYDVRDNGVWEYTPQCKELQALKRQMQKLMEPTKK